MVRFVCGLDVVIVEFEFVRYVLRFSCSGSSGRTSLFVGLRLGREDIDIVICCFDGGGRLFCVVGVYLEGRRVLVLF